MAVIPDTNVNLAANIRDVLNAAGGSVNNNVITFFQSGAKINKWSLKKPVVFPSTAAVTLDNIKSKYCGLTPMSNDALLKGCANYEGGTPANNDVAAVEAAQKEWAYAPPTGGANSPYRLSDFRGYNTSAQVPDSGWRDFELKKDDLNTYANTGIESEGTGFDWHVKNTFGTLPYFNLKFDAPSSAVVGSAGNVEIPITYIVGDKLVSSELWRIAFAVYIPTLTTTGKWQLFTSRKTLKSATSTADIAELIPSLATNTHAASQMFSSNLKSFKAIPCLVKNAKITLISGNSPGILKSSIALVSSSTVVYSMPSGQKSITINIKDSASDAPSVPGMHTEGYSKNRQWVIGIVSTGYTGSPYYRNIAGVLVAKTSAITADTLVTVSFKYTHMTDVASGKTETLDKYFSQTVKAGTTTTVNGNEFFGTYAITPSPGTSIVKGSVVWTTP